MNFETRLPVLGPEFTVPYRGHFVRRNILVGKRDKGGHECELDVVAFNPETQRLVHVKPSMDANTWVVREARYAKKFEA